MHQTFYIDIDEEITSIVERLRKSKSKEVVIVVPKRALLIQSIINLKLLKKEADSLEKEIIIVTQDKFGKLLIEKTGIIVEQKLDKIEGSEMNVAEESRGDKPLEEYKNQSTNWPKNRLDTMGSSGFFDNSDNKIKEKEVNFGMPKEPNEGVEKLINLELVTGIGESIKSKKSEFFKKKPENAGFGEMIKNIDIKQKGNDIFRPRNIAVEAFGRGKRKIMGSSKFFRIEKLTEEKKPETMSQPEYSSRSVDIISDEKTSRKKDSNQDDNSNVNLPKKFLKYLPMFGLIAVLIISATLTYLFLPKAAVKVSIKTKIQSIDAEIKADVKNDSVDLDKKIIPAKLVSINDEISRNFESTGAKGASSHKARGMITIYNEFSSAMQPLVATTRFLSEDGKLFRLVNSVNVPGFTKVSEEIKMGAIEAEVVADEAGDEYNIAPSRFSIPGFQGSGSDKHVKIYAKSFKAMNGGAKDTETVKSVSESDINSAKNKLASEMNSIIKQKIKDEVGQEFTVLDDAINIIDPTYKTSNAIGEITSNFTATIKISAKAIVVRERDIKEIIKGLLLKNIGDNSIVLEDSIAEEIGKSDADFVNSQLTIRTHGSGKISSNLDLEKIKNDILGKNENELESYFKTYPDISQFEIRYWPTFISGKIPAYLSRLEVNLDNN